MKKLIPAILIATGLIACNNSSPETQDITSDISTAVSTETTSSAVTTTVTAAVTTVTESFEYYEDSFDEIWYTRDNMISSYDMKGLETSDLFEAAIGSWTSAFYEQNELQILEIAYYGESGDVQFDTIRVKIL